LIAEAPPNLPKDVVKEDLQVVDCVENSTATSESRIYSKSGDVVWRYKWADPKLLDTNTRIAPGSIFATLRGLACRNEMRTPLIDKDDLRAQNLTSIASTPAGDGEVFYVGSDHLEIGERDAKQDWKTAAVMTRFNQDKKADVVNSLFAKIPGGAPVFRTMVGLVYIRCSESQFSVIKTEMYDASGRLVYIGMTDLNGITWADIQSQQQPVISVLQRVVCSSDKEAK
jgi:hypothetical protein